MSSPNKINPDIRPPTRSGETESANKTRPSGLPRADKNFKKVLKEVAGEPEDDIVDAEEVKEDEPNPSLFDISKTSKKPMVKSPMAQSSNVPPQSALKTTKPIISQYPLADSAEIQTDADALLADETMEDQPVDKSKLPAKPMVTTEKESKVDDDFSLNEAGRRATAMNKTKKTKDTAPSVEDSIVVVPKKEKPQVNAKLTGAGQENPNQNMSGYNQANIAFNTEKPEVKEEEAPRATIRELAARIIEKIQTMRTEGKTDTIVTLRNPPMLEGATMTLSAMDGAKREFNISFTNLTDAGKLFLDRKLSEDNLTQILERKGIIVNTLRTTTLPELPLATDSDNRFYRDQQQRDEQQQQQRRQNQTFDAEDTA